MAVPFEKFVKQLEDCGIIAGDTLKDFIPPKASPKDAEELAKELIRQKKLTKFQAEEISKGKGKSLTLGNYVLLEKIGAGGMGQVFRAEHRRMHRRVAIKLLPPAMTKDTAAIARFEREVTILKKLKHPNIVPCLWGGKISTHHAIAMELVDGGTLADELRKRGRLPWEEVIRIGQQICSALECAHNQDI